MWLIARLPLSHRMMLDPAVTAGGRGWRTARSVLLCCALAVLFSLTPAAAATDQRAKAAELQALRERIKTLRTELEQVKGQEGTFLVKLRLTEQEIGRAHLKLNRLEQRLSEVETEIGRLHERQASLKKELAGQQDALAGQVVAAYAMGRQERMKLFLNQEDPSTVARTLVYYDYVNRARAAQIDVAKSSLRALAAVAQDIGRERAELENLRKDRLAEVERLESNRQARQEVLDRLKDEINAKGTELKNLESNERELQRLLEALAKALADIPAEPGDRRPFRNLKGHLPWPVAGHLAAQYGQPRNVGNLSWRGVLIDAPRGQEVKAVSHGRVAFSGWLRGFGLLVIVDHGDGYMSLYGHNETLHKETGDWVEAGEPIASVGDSGGQEHAGLYFEIRQDGRPVNPRRWCGPMPRVRTG